MPRRSWRSLIAAGSLSCAAGLVLGHTTCMKAPSEDEIIRIRAGIARSGRGDQHVDRTQLEEIEGYWFKNRELSLDAAQRIQLQTILDGPDFYRSFSGEKKCGGFHPDFEITWASGRARLLICFGCDEAKLVRPWGVSRYDMQDRSADALESLLEGLATGAVSTHETGPSEP